MKSWLRGGLRGIIIGFIMGVVSVFGILDFLVEFLLLISPEFIQEGLGIMIYFTQASFFGSLLAHIIFFIIYGFVFGVIIGLIIQLVVYFKSKKNLETVAQ